MTDSTETNSNDWPSLLPGQRCRVQVYDTVDRESVVVYETDERLYEAPNWLAGDTLVLNGDGVLWALPLGDGGKPEHVPIHGVPTLNNDHVPDPRGGHIFVSANDFQIYRAPLRGGAAERITDPADGILHFLHGVDPTGQWLAYVGIRYEEGVGLLSSDIREIGVDGRGDHQVSSGGVADGSEYSPEGEWIYFNTEQFTDAPGHAQIARIRPDGTGVERQTFSDRVDWFPHLSPDGTRAVYLSFPPGITGHPGNLDVELHIVDTGDWIHPLAVLPVFGGQGTLNVNSWSPDGRRFAFVDYPIS